MKHKPSKKKKKKKKKNHKKGDIVIIKSDEKNRGKWKIDTVNQLFKGQDGTIRGVRRRAGQSY